MQVQVENNIIKSIIRLAPEILKNHPVLFAYLFGSFATGCVHPFSDIDIAIYTTRVSPAKRLELELLLSLKFDEKLDCKAKSEVRIINNLPLVIKGQVISDGLLIFSANDVERVDFETRVRSAYFDFLPVIQNYHRVYLEKALS
jgi:predicted nucleotidyltransferase